MGKYLLPYSAFTDFRTEQGNEKYVKSIIPGVAYTKDTEEVFYNPQPKNLIVDYNIPETFDIVTFPCNLWCDDMFGEEGQPEKISDIALSITVDGVSLDVSTATSEYRFTTYGKHRMVMELKDEVTELPASFLSPYSHSAVFPEVVTIPYGILHLGEYMFLSCAYLRRINLPDGLLTISRSDAQYPYYGLFTGCNSLTSLTIPKSVEYVGAGCFTGSGLKEIIAKPTVEPSYGNYIWPTEQNGVLYYPAGSDYSSWIAGLSELHWTSVEI